jgi:hypothetical protein
MAYILDRGQITLSAAASELTDRDVFADYMGRA